VTGRLHKYAVLFAAQIGLFAAPVLAQSGGGEGGGWTVPIVATTIFISAGLALLAYVAGHVHCRKDRDKVAQRERAEHRSTHAALQAILLEHADGAMIIDQDVVKTKVGLFSDIGSKTGDERVDLLNATDLSKNHAPGPVGQGYDAQMRRDRPAIKLAQFDSHLSLFPHLAWKRDLSGKLTWVNDLYVEAVDNESAVNVINAQIELLPAQRGTLIRRISSQAHQEGSAVSERHAIALAGRFSENEQTVFDIVETPTEWGSFGCAIDVTEHVNSAHALRERLTAYDTLVSRSERGWAHFDEKNQLSFFNEKFAELLRLDDGWLRSNPSLKAVLNYARDSMRVPSVGDFDEWRDALVETNAALSERDTAEWHLPNGTVLDLVRQPYTLGGAMWVLNDMTSLHELRRSAATASAVHKVAVSRLSEAVAVVGLDGKCTLANEAMLELWKLDPHETEGAHISDIADRCAPFLNDQSVWDRIKTHISGATEAREVWSEMVRRNDGKVLRLSTAPLPDGATLFAFGDITDSYTKEQLLQTQNEKLAELSRLKSQFLSSIHGASHELKIPLNTIVGFSEILAQQMYGELNARQHEYIDGIHEASNQLRQLVGSIIDLAMLEADYFAFRVESIDVATMLSSAVKYVERNTEQGTRIRFLCPADIGELPGDAPRFREIAHTLIKALKDEAEDEDVIEVGAKREKDHISFWIGTQKGIVPRTVRDIVRNEFHDETMPDMRRVALGITLVRQFIERQGGTLSIEKDKGGTREAVVYRLHSNADAVRSAINRDRSYSSVDAAE